MAQSKEQNKPPKTDPKGMKVHELPDKQCKTIILKMLNVLRESTAN